VPVVDDPAAGYKLVDHETIVMSKGKDGTPVYKVTAGP
jgi:hypothetical protein